MGNTFAGRVAASLLQAIGLLTSASLVFARRCVSGLEADVEKCEANIERSLAMCTALVPEVGYDKAAKISKVAYDSGRTVRDVALLLEAMAGYDARDPGSLDRPRAPGEALDQRR